MTKARTWAAAGLGILFLFWPGRGSMTGKEAPLGPGPQALRLSGLVLLGGSGFPGLCLAQALDLTDFRRRILPAASDRFFSDPNPEVEEAKAQAGGGRLYYSPAAEAEANRLGLVRGGTLSVLRRRLVPNLPLVEGLRQVEGYDALRPRRLDQFMGSLLGPESPPWERKNYGLLSAPLAAFVPRERGEGKTEIALKTQPSRGRAFFTAWRPANSPEEALAELGEGSEALPLEAPEVREGPPIPGRLVSWSEDRWGRIRLELEGVTEPGWLFLSLGFDPGLRAECQGEARRLAPAALAFSALELRPGDQVLRLDYRPDSFLVGLFGSLLGLVLAGALVTAFRGASRPAKG